MLVHVRALVNMTRDIFFSTKMHNVLDTQSLSTVQVIALVCILIVALSKCDKDLLKGCL